MMMKYEQILKKWMLVVYCYYKFMNSQNSQNDSMDFSVIDKNESKRGGLDFSVQSLLEKSQDRQLQIKQSDNISPSSQEIKKLFKRQPITKSIMIEQNKQIQLGEPGQSFLRDLQKLQQELSYEAESYNIYDHNNSNSEQLLQYNKSKTLSCLKLTKQFTNKSFSKENWNQFNDYYGHLVIDFHGKKQKKENKKKNSKLDAFLDSKSSKSSFRTQSREQSKIDKSKAKSSKKQIETVIKSYKKTLNNQRDQSKSKKSDSKHKIPLLKSSSREEKNQFSIKLRQSVSKNNESQVYNKTEPDPQADKIYRQYYGQINLKSTNLSSNEVKNKNIKFLKSKQKSREHSSKITIFSPRKIKGTKLNIK